MKISQISFQVAVNQTKTTNGRHWRIGLDVH